MSLVKRHLNVHLDPSAKNQVMPLAAYRGIVKAVGVRKLMWGTDWIGSPNWDPPAKLLAYD